MLAKKLYLQICAIFVASLVGFAVLASIAWAIIGHDQADSDLFRKSAALSELLIPSIDADIDEQTNALSELHQALDFDLALYTQEGLLLTFVGKRQPELNLRNKPIKGSWTESRGGTLWQTQLEDGRFLVINLERIQLPGESEVFVIFLMIIALGMMLIIYPFIRHLTARLERLEASVQQVGTGNLDARVIVEGSDEVAKLAESFNEAAERIQLLVQSQHLLLANASHELRTPLTRIRLGLEMLEKNRTPERMASLVDDLSELDVLIDEVMMMTRIDTGVGQRDFEVFDLMGLVAEECARYRDCEVSGASALINGDRRMIQHAIRNLVDNGIKHGEPPIQVVVRVRESFVILSVRDQGIGIENADMEKLFQPFQRGKGKQNLEGAGLGLSLVKKIVDMHEGDIQLHNDDGLVVSLRFKLS